MNIIVIASQKGGVGKTTLTGHLGVQASVSGHGPVALLDTDPQGSLADWWNVREASKPIFAAAKISALPAAIAELKKAGVKTLLIDTPPAVTDINKNPRSKLRGINPKCKTAGYACLRPKGRGIEPIEIKTVVALADLVIIPTRPSPHDLRAVGKTVDIVNGCGKRMMFVINGPAHRARITADAAIALSQHGAVAPTIIYQRTDYASSMIDGRTVGELDPNSKSALEIVYLWNYVNTHFNQYATKRK